MRLIFAAAALVIPALFAQTASAQTAGAKGAGGAAGAAPATAPPPAAAAPAAAPAPAKAAPAAAAKPAAPAAKPAPAALPPPLPPPAPAAAPAELTPTTGVAPAPAAPAAEHKPAAAVGLGLSPNIAQITGGTNISDKAAEALTPTTSSGGSEEWKFDFHGYMRGPMRVSWGPPTPIQQPSIYNVTPEQGGVTLRGGPCTTMSTGHCYYNPADPNMRPPAPSGTQLHSWPRVPGLDYVKWEYTNTLGGPWAQLNFSYGNSRAMMTVAIDSYSQTSGGYRNLQGQQGIDQAFVTLNFPEAFGNYGGLVWNIGSFQNRYGTAGKYDGGMYETYLFGRTHVSGETLTANLDFGGDWAFSVEKGIGAKLEVVPFLNNQHFQIFKSIPMGQDQAPYLSDRDIDYLPYSGPVPQGSTFLGHIHAGASYKRIWTFGAHFLYTWTPDDNWHPLNSARANVADQNPRANGPTKGRIWVGGAEARLNGGAFGDGYIGYSHVDAKDINALADSLELLHSFGGWQFKQNFFGKTFHQHTGVYLGPQNESGKLDNLAFQYSFSLGSWFRRPESWWGQGPDLVFTVFGMFTRVFSRPMPVAPSNDPVSTKKLKFGGDVLYTPIEWFGIGGRFDMVQPDLDAAYARTAGNPGGSELNFTVLSPRIVFRTQFVTHEAVTIQYQHYFLGSGAYPNYPYEWVRKSDANTFYIAGTMWW
jgi:hypothetical protein